MYTTYCTKSMHVVGQPLHSVKFMQSVNMSASLSDHTVVKQHTVI